MADKSLPKQITRRSTTPSMSPAGTTKKKTTSSTSSSSSSSSSLFSSFSCGCNDSNSVAASEPSSNRSSATHRRVPDRSSASNSLTSSPFSPFALDLSKQTDTNDADDNENNRSSATFSGLLRQLHELEQNVNSWTPPSPPPPAAECPGEHRRTESGKVEESVAVVKDSDDPLGDFRKSMLHMIVEKEIIGGAELRELLGRFLALNAPHHHEAILQAFAEIWAEVFSGYNVTPELLRPSGGAAVHPRCRRPWRY